MRPRRVEAASLIEAGEKLAPVRRVMCQRGKDLARRTGHLGFTVTRMGAVLKKSRSTARQANMQVSLLCDGG